VVGLLGLFGAWYDIPVRGPAWLLMVATAAFVLATEGLGLLIIAWTANLRVSLGLASVILGSAAAFAGVTFPLAAMPLGPRIWAQVLPLMHAMGLARAGISVGAPKTAGGPLLALALTTAITFGLALPRLPALLRDPVYWRRP
jgi:ABC-2 type transport system permease protein